jgi:hypothetical protein
MEEELENHLIVQLVLSIVMDSAIRSAKIHTLVSGQSAIKNALRVQLNVERFAL